MYKFDFKLDDFQEEAVFHINNGKSIVVCAPTGAGKTCIAEHAIHKALETGKRIFYTTPLKALSNQKYSDFARKYGTENVGLLTGDSSINRDGKIVVMTTEVFRNMLYGTNFGSVTDNLRDVKYVVLDEVHYMNDEQRGTVWEESIIYCPPDIQIIALSATVANSQALTDWINTVHSKTELVYTDFRPVPLRFFYFDSSQPHDVLPLLTPSGQLNKKIRPEKRQRGRYGKKQPQRSTVKDVINALHRRDMLPAIYFTFSRKKCDEQMEKCCDLQLVSRKEQAQIQEVIDEYIAENPYLWNNKHLEFLRCGVASHHAGLLPGWKVLVEKLFQKGLIKVVFATETLAAGINMPARSTVISAISKRTDNGHRTLTASEFLQMSGRAGRRGMDEVGYVTIVGSQFETPEDVAELVLSDANPLESRFSPGYSMVINLLQRFSQEQAKELILKSFGYFSSTERMKGLLDLQIEAQGRANAYSEFRCFSGLTTQDLLNYNKLRNVYVENKKVLKTLNKQLKNTNKYSQEHEEFRIKVKSMCAEMNACPCNTCRVYKKHMKAVDLMERENKRVRDLDKTISKQKDLYWNKFISHKAVLEQLGYIEDNFPNEKGVVVAMVRAENELYIAEIIQSGVLDNLTPAELASVICAVNTEDLRADMYASLPVSKNVKLALGRIKEIRRKLAITQRNYDIETPMYINSFYSPLIELWIKEGNWENVVNNVESGEGDVVRSFKRTVDVLRQITILPNINPELADKAREAIDAIMKEPIDVD